MKPTLYVDDRSPPVRSILMLIDEIQLDVEIELIDLFKQENLKPAYLQVRFYLSIILIVFLRTIRSVS